MKRSNKFSSEMHERAAAMLQAALKFTHESAITRSQSLAMGVPPIICRWLT